MNDIIKHVEHKGELMSFSINTNSEVFNGHFPQFPILPGVFELYIMEKIIESKFNLKLSLIKIQIVKFLKPILPNENDIYLLNFKENKVLEGHIEIDCQITKEGKNICSFLGIFQIL